MNLSALIPTKMVKKGRNQDDKVYSNSKLGARHAGGANTTKTILKIELPGC